MQAPHSDKKTTFNLFLTFDKKGRWRVNTHTGT
jgi:hypothetical protein